ncbi:MAG: SpoIIE family protein phosphatase [Acidobacteria bacterium]|nr:SpoIIE family protein phosphatase [Acidobacteriota bacterium]
MATTPTWAGLERPRSRQLPLEQVEDLIKLERAAQKITSILDLDELIDKIVTEVAQSFGCVEANIYLYDEANRELMLTGVCGCTMHGKGSRKKLGEGMTGHAAETGKMHYAPDVRVDPYYIACEPGTLSELAIPLEVEHHLVGVFSASHHELDGFTPAQLRLLEALSTHIAVAVRNARRFVREREERERMSRDAQEARAIQQALLPKASPLIPGFSITGLTVPAGEVGGDWYDFIPFEDGSLGLVLADVAGKGTAAALLMSATRAMLRSLAATSASPAETLSRLNRLMAEDFPSGRFVTLIYAVLDPARRTLKFSSAGHLPPLLVARGTAHFLETESGTPLGLGESYFSETEIELPPGARMVLYSDGITEAAGLEREEYGPERLQKHALEGDASSESILEEVRRHANGRGLEDDATVIFLAA